MNTRGYCFFILFIAFIVVGCANITAPTGGKKDKTPPKLLFADPPDSLLNTKPKRIELHFDEYITVSDVAKEVQLSPILSIAPSVNGLNKHVVIKIVDSLLEDNTTYRLSFGNAIKDLHEGNVFAHYTYTFSTGSYFDSLQLHGTITDAETGLGGVDGAIVELYYAKDGDSAVVRHKPKYVTKADASGNFSFKGLPRRNFRIYALKDANDNLIYDGPVDGEKIGFADNVVIPDGASQASIDMRVFAETPDSVVKRAMDSTANNKDKGGFFAKPKAKADYNYSLNLDTSRADKRTFDINNPIRITFGKLPTFNYQKITLDFDSMGVTFTPSLTFAIDSAKKILNVTPNRWSEDKIYTLRLVKGFAKDSAGGDIVPSRYTFHTMSEEDDYGEITMHFPARYVDRTYLFRVMADGDSLSQKPIIDTTMVLHRLKPAKYTFRIIVDQNHNGKWDPGDLFAKKQPEMVIPYKDAMNVRAGFQYDQNWEMKPQSSTAPDPGNKLPGGK